MQAVEGGATAPGSWAKKSAWYDAYGQRECDFSVLVEKIVTFSCYEVRIYSWKTYGWNVSLQYIAYNPNSVVTICPLIKTRTVTNMEGFRTCVENESVA
jgi:hypothetical protein